VSPVTLVCECGSPEIEIVVADLDAHPGEELGMLWHQYRQGVKRDRRSLYERK
jgi:hypothetical protein